MTDIQKAIQALKLCEHGNYHCQICEVRLLKQVISEQQELIEQKDVAIETLKEAISAVVSEGRNDHKKIQEKLNLIEIEAKKLLKERNQKDAEIEKLREIQRLLVLSQLNTHE